MKLFDAYNLAEKIKGVLAHYCDRIEVAGSIRRARPEVSDIDFVCLPKDPTAAALRQRCTRVAALEKDGPQYMEVSILVPAGITHHASRITIDIWFAHCGTRDLIDATPSNWGSLLLCRTGSKEHNIWIAQRARAMDLKWETSRGLVVNPDTVKAKIVASETEEEIFKCLGLDFIPPVERERRLPTANRENREGESLSPLPPLPPVQNAGPDYAEAFS